MFVKFYIKIKELFNVQSLFTNKKMKEKKRKFKSPQISHTSEK